MRSRWELPGILGFFVLGVTLLVPSPARADEPQVTNPSFETPDPADATKPLGWYRQTFINDEIPPDPNGPWKYITNGTAGDTTHTGTHSISVTGGNAGTYYSWEMEGQVSGKGATFDGNVNPDNHGNGPFVQVISGGLYRISAWYKKTFVGADCALRYTLSNTASGGLDDASAWGGGGTSYVDANAVNVWRQISVDFIVPANQNRIILRAYSVNVPAGQTIYWDDFSVELLGLPQTFTGTVTNSKGDPIAKAAVGTRMAGANGLADPEAAATTNDQGQFTLTFPKQAGDYVVQAWLPENGASAEVALQPAGTPTNITYDPAPLANLAVGKPIAAWSSAQPNGDNPPSEAIDGSYGTRWTSRGEDVQLYPHFFVVDLGSSINFGTDVKQINVWWETALANKYQVRVSDTPPDPAMTGPTGNHALALTYGTVVYDSPASAGTRNWNPSSGVFVDAITNMQPATGRYVMLLCTERYGGYTNVSVWEFQVEVPATVVTGQIVDTTNTGVGGAVLVELPGRTHIITADNNGVFTMNLPRIGAATTYFAHALTGDKVYSASNSFSILPAGDTMDVGKITIGGPADNLIPVGATTDTYATAAPSDDITDPTMLPAKAVDHDFTTRWSTAHIPDFNTVVTPTNPIYVIVDMGAAQTVNHIVIDWETARPSSYRVQVATTYNMAGRNGGDWKDVKVSTGPPEETMIYNWGGGDYIDYIHFAAQSARYIRLVIENAVSPFDNISAWEVQAANLALLPPPPLTYASQVLRILGGLEAAPSDISTLNVVTTGASANVLDVADAVALAQQGK